MLINYYKISEGLTETENLQLDNELTYIISFDQATNTGISIFDEQGTLKYLIYVSKYSTESVYEYKIKLMNFISDILKRYKVDTIVHERVYGGVSYDTSKSLILIEGLFKELKCMYQFNYRVFPIINTVWKSTILNESLKQTSQEQKHQIKQFILETYPFLSDNLPQDIYDSIGIGQAYFKVKKENIYRLIKLTKGDYNKRIGVDYEVYQFDVDEKIDLFSIIDRNLKFRNILYEKGITAVEYDDSFDVFEYMKMAVSHFDCLTALFIFDNRKMGSICLRLGIPYQKNKFLIILLKKK